jgi:beta-lactamase class A
MVRRLLVAATVLAVCAAPAWAGDHALVAAVDGGVAGTSAASAAAAGGAPERVQALYDRARDLQEQLRAAAPVSPSCHALGGWAARFASTEVASAEAFDRLRPVRARRLQRAAQKARRRVDAARRACHPLPAPRVHPVASLVEPRDAAAFFGPVVARAPAGADAAVVVANGVPAGSMALGGGVARARLAVPPGRYDLEVRFSGHGRPVGRARADGVWLLPAAAGTAPAAGRLDPAWQAAVRAAASAFSGSAAAWIQDLATGRSAGWNVGARFPAASTVKLGVFVEALRRMGAAPDRSALFHDVSAIGAWSSNLAANRLLPRVGGRAAVEAALARMGAASSTYPGPYIVATALPSVDAPDPPPRVSRRVTTAYDLGGVMRVIHEAARGAAVALRQTGLSRAQARLALGLLLASEQDGDNRGLFRDALGPAPLAAQKQGWIGSARNSAAVVYTSRGPVVVVALTYRPGLTRAAAARFGGRLITIAEAAP